MIQCEKGEIYLINSVEINGDNNIKIRRPVIIVQNNIANKYSTTVMVASITSIISKVKLPTHVAIDLNQDGLAKESIILLEQIYTISKNRLVEKIGKVSDNVLDKINRALEISFDINVSRDISKEEKDEYITNISRPLILTEGKTDVKIIETAWNKLYPDKKMFFECQSSGIQYEKNEKVGSAESVRRTLEYLAVTIDRPIVGLFDNDWEGNKQFKGLNKDVFEKYNINHEVRKHKNTCVWGMLLPVPDNRKFFVTDNDITQRYFVIEHYFSDEVLKRYNMYGNNILGTCIFKVNNKKDKFSEEVKELEVKEFVRFKMLFDKLENLLKE